MSLPFGQRGQYSLTYQIKFNFILLSEYVTPVSGYYSHVNSPSELDIETPLSFPQKQNRFPHLSVIFRDFPSDTQTPLQLSQPRTAPRTVVHTGLDAPQNRLPNTFPQEIMSLSLPKMELGPKELEIAQRMKDNLSMSTDEIYGMNIQVRSPFCSLGLTNDLTLPPPADWGGTGRG